MELQHLTPRPEGGVMHAEIRREGSTIMLADATPEYRPMSAGLFIYVNDTDDTYQLALDHGATSVLPPDDRPYGRAAGVKDTWGNTWWITSITTSTLAG